MDDSAVSTVPLGKVWVHADRPFASFEEGALPDPFSWDSVMELRAMAIAFCPETYYVKIKGITEEVWMEGKSIALATKDQILAAAISVLRPMEVDEAVRLVKEGKEE